MGLLGTVLIGLLILVGLGGALTQLYPGPLLVAGALVVWAVLTGGTAAWVCTAIGLVAILTTGVGKYVVMGRTVAGADLGRWPLIVGALAGVVGFFLVPVVGLPLGFVLGVYLTQWVRLRDEGSARQAAVVALKAQGWAILLELGGCLIAVVAWGVGVAVAG